MYQKNLRNYIKYIILTFVILISNNIYAGIGGDFTLKDQYNNDFTLSDSSKVKIIFFGF